VKRWAKTAGFSSTRSGFISSYSWTLLTIYYLQVSHGLPSAHAVLEQESRGNHAGSVESVPSFQCQFADVSRCRSQYTTGVGNLSLGTLLLRFFSFYAHEFDWQKEVVSVRLGTRTQLDDSSHLFSPRFLTKPSCGSLNIEDPVEWERNLNFALTSEKAAEILAVIKAAEAALQSGDTSCLSLPSKPPPERWLEDPRSMLERRLDGYLAASTTKLVCKCEFCDNIMRYEKLLEHKPACRRENAKLPEVPLGSVACGTCFRLFSEKCLRAHQVATGHSGTIHPISEDESD